MREALGVAGRGGAGDRASLWWGDRVDAGRRRCSADARAAEHIEICAKLLTSQPAQAAAAAEADDADDYDEGW